MKNILCLFNVAIVCLILSTSSIVAAPANLQRHADPVPDEYVVVLSDRGDVRGVARAVASSYGGEILEVYQNVLFGFLLRAPEGIAERVASDPRVRFVEQNFNVELAGTRTLPAAPSEHLWHLDRLDEDSPSVRDYTYDYCRDGTHSTLYFLDGGIDRTHQEFIVGGISRVIYQRDYQGGGGISTNRCVNSDKGWHGTAVASVAAGNQVGVASDARIVDVRTHSCSGGTTLAKLVSALDWINSNDRRNITHPKWNLPWHETDNPTDPLFVDMGVINMSAWRNPLDGNGTLYSSIEVAVRDIVAAGFPFVTSANNYSISACNFAPANLGVGGTGAPGSTSGGTIVHVSPSVLTVGGTEMVDGVDYRWDDGLDRDQGSNSGACVSAWAPAKNIYSAMHSRSSVQQNNYGSPSGTSFSSPMVAGLVARYQEWFYAVNQRIPAPSEVYSWAISQSWPTVSNSATPAHYKCWGVDADGNSTVVGRLQSCTSLGLQPWTQLTSDGYFSGTSNTTAGVIHWQEGVCRQRPVGH